MPRKKRISVESNTTEEKVAVPEEKVVERKARVPQRVQKVKEETAAPPPPEKVAKLKPAVPSEVAKTLTTSIALKTCSKFCGQWFHLIRGKAVTATAPQIAYLRSCGLVE